MKSPKKSLLLVLLLIWITPVIAQDCPDVVQTALEVTSQICDATNRNQVCYGNIRLDAESQPGIADFKFDEEGDIVDVAGVQSLQLSSLNAASEEWGVALMRLQANLPDTLPGQNVTFLLFGDVKIANAVETNVEPVTVDVTADGNANVRSGPTTDSAIVGSLAGGQTATAIGRLEDNSWLQIELPSGGTGWIFAELVTPTDDVTLLSFVDPTAAPEAASRFGPMQAFYFRSGINDAPCAEAPSSGLLIQTPQGVWQITLSVNGVNLTLASTVYLQADPGNQMTISTLAGIVQVEAAGVTQISLQGTQVQVPIDANLQAVGPPSPPQPYNANLLLPVAQRFTEAGLIEPLEADTACGLYTTLAEQGLYTLLTADELVRPLTQDEIEQLTPLVAEQIEAACAIPPLTGIWRESYGPTTVAGECLGPVADGGSSGYGDRPYSQAIPLCSVGGGAALLIYDAGVRYERSEPGMYSDESTFEEPLFDGTDNTFQSTIRHEYHVISPDRIERVTTISQEGGCTITTSLVLELVRADENVTCSSASAVHLPPDNGIYTVNWLPPDNATYFYCDQQIIDTILNFTEMTFVSEGNGTRLNIAAGEETLTVEETGLGRYSFSEYAADGSSVSVEFDVMAPHQVFGSWNVATPAGAYCSRAADLTFAEAVEAGAVPAPAQAVEASAVPAPAEDAASQNAPIEMGVYTATWQPLVGDCEAMMADVPTFTEATLSVADDGNLVVDFDTGSYRVPPVDSGSGQYMVMETRDDRSSMVNMFIAIPGMSPPLVMVSGSLTAADGASCSWTGQLTLES